jgi:hypothetical protein
MFCIQNAHQAQSGEQKQPERLTSTPDVQTFGENACHPERSEGSLRPARQILRCAQDDRQDAQDDSQDSAWAQGKLREGLSREPSL